MNKIQHYKDTLLWHDDGGYTPPHKPEIIVLSGIPCSGKSTFAKKYIDFTIISRDDIRDKFWGGNFKITRDNENRVTTLFNDYFNTCVKNRMNIILDNTHCKESYLNEWITRKPNEYTLRIKFFYVPLFTAHIRNIIRYLTKGKWIPFKVINNMKKNFDNINKEKYANIYM